MHPQSDEHGNLFIRTDQLDGETDWKLRKAVKHVHDGVRECGEVEWLSSSGARVTCARPTENIYEFAGVYEDEASGVREALSLENTVWASTVLANGRMVGLVVQAGRETRMSMNSREPKTKFGLLDAEVNAMTVWLFALMAVLAALVVVVSRPQMEFTHMVTQYVRYFILLSNIIPISMRVNLEFAKLVYAYKIGQDASIEGTITRNSNIPESLGRVSYLLSDKTGTLTQNDMIFKRLSLEQCSFSYEECDEMRRILREQWQRSSRPMQDVCDRGAVQVQK